LKRFTCERCRVPFIVTFSDSILQEKRFSEPRKKRSNVLNTATSFYPGAGNISSKNNSEEKRLMDDKRKLKVIQELFRYVCVISFLIPKGTEKTAVDHPLCTECCSLVIQKNEKILQVRKELNPRHSRI
jgi:hypothetical protein